MTERGDEGRAPMVLRMGLPVGGAIVVVALGVGAAFAGTSDWGFAIPIGVVLGGVSLAVVWIGLRRRGVSVTRWIDDYWSRED